MPISRAVQNQISAVLKQLWITVCISPANSLLSVEYIKIKAMTLGFVPN